MKNKILYTILAAVLISICVISCSKEEKIIPGEINISEGTDLYAEAPGEQITITFTANKEWSISSRNEWCKVTPASGGDGTHKVTITIEENTTQNERVAWIHIVCEDVLKSINITQNKYDIVSIIHNKISFTVPELVGNGVIGKINWGDGNTEDYKTNLTHNYSTDSTHIVQLTLLKAVEIKLKNLQGIQELDLTNF